MKSMVDGPPQTGEAHKVIERSRSRQGWLLVVFGALIAIGGTAIRLNRPKPIEIPTVTFASAAAPTSGLVGQVLVKPGEQVRKGELLAVLDFSHLRSASDAALQNVIAAAEQTTNETPILATPLPPPGLTGSFQKKAVLVKAPVAPLPPVNPTNVQVVPEGGTPFPDVSALEQKGKDLQDKIAAETKAIQALQQKMSADQDAASAAQSLVVSLTAVASRTKADADKAATLLAEGVISANDATKAQGYALQAQGQLQEAKISAAQAEAILGDTERAIVSAQSVLGADQAAVKENQKQIEDAKKHPKIVAQPLRAAPATSTAPPPAKYELKQVRGPIAPTGPAAPAVVNFMTAAQVVERLKKAQDELALVNRDFSTVCIYASTDGTITGISAKSGQMVTRGSILFQIRR